MTSSYTERDEARTVLASRMIDYADDETSYLEQLGRIFGAAPGFEGEYNPHDLSKWISQLLSEEKSGKDISLAIDTVVEYLRGMVESGKISPERAIGLARVLSVDLKKFKIRHTAFSTRYGVEDFKIYFNLNGLFVVNEVIEKFEKFQPLTKENISKITNEVFLKRISLDRVREIISDVLLERFKKEPSKEKEKIISFIMMVNSSLANIDLLLNQISQNILYDSRNAIKKLVMDNKKFFLRNEGVIEDSRIIYSKREESIYSMRSEFRGKVLTEIIDRLTDRMVAVSDKIFSELNNVSNILVECSSLLDLFLKESREDSFQKFSQNLNDIISSGKVVLDNLLLEINSFLKDSFLLGSEFRTNLFQVYEISESEGNVWQNTPQSFFNEKRDSYLMSQPSGSISQGDFFINSRRMIEEVLGNMDAILNYDLSLTIHTKGKWSIDDLREKMVNFKRGTRYKNFLDLGVVASSDSISYLFSIKQGVIDELAILGIEKNTLDKVMKEIDNEIFENNFAQTEIENLVEDMIEMNFTKSTSW